LYKKIAVFSAHKPVKNLLFNFFGVEGCVVDHPRITIIKEEEEEYVKIMRSPRKMDNLPKLQGSTPDISHKFNYVKQHLVCAIYN
jgi:hypothetical protein